MTPKVLNRSMKLSLASGVSFVFWFLICSPQPLFNVFIQNYLEASSAGLGLLVGTISLLGVFHLLGVPIFQRLETPKWVWLFSHVLHRLNGFVLAIVSFSIANGGSKQTAFVTIFITMIISWVLTNITGSGWWSWMAELIPEKIRARFFGKRSSYSNIANILWFFTVTLVLDLVREEEVFTVFGYVFIIAGIAGIVDILLHLPMPELRKPVSQTAPVAKTLLEPIKNRNFVRFALAVGLSLFSINIIAPFIPPYLVGPQIGASTIWLGIQFVISQFTWILLAPVWGLVMDKFGRKPVVILGLMTTFSWLGYFFITDMNFPVIIPLVSFLGGILAPAYWEGINQMMLSIAPEKNRIAYVAWYWMVFGVSTAFGAFAGGFLSDFLDKVTLDLSGFPAFDGFRITLFLSLLMVSISAIVLLRIEEPNVKPLSFVVSRIANAGFFRTFITMGVVRGNPDSTRVATALRSIDGYRSDVVADEILERLYDPEPEVRVEAVRALGRIGSGDSVEPLVHQLRDENSTIRSEAARALGKIGDKRAIPYLVEGLSSSSEDIQEASVYALGEIGGEESARELMGILKEMPVERVRASGASAVSRLGILEAAWEIVPFMIFTGNGVLRIQLATALANLLGNTGEFYVYITGEGTEDKIARLFGTVRRNAKNVFGPGGTKILSQSIMRFESASPKEAVILLREYSIIALQQLYPQVPKEKLLDEVMGENPRMGIWFWLLKEFLSNQVDGNNEDYRLYGLLGYYCLSRLENNEI